MTQQETKQLAIIVRKEIYSAFESEHFAKAVQKEVGSALEQIVLPELTALKIDVAELKTDVAALKIDVAELKTDVAYLKNDVTHLKTDVGVIKTRYPDKAYLDDKIADLRGNILQGRKIDSARVDKHIDLHNKRGNLTKNDILELDEMRGFAPLSA